MSDIDLIIQTRVDGIKDITSLSSSLKQLNSSVKGVFVPMSKLDSHTRALNKALAMGSNGAREHATSLKGLIANQKTLREETKRVAKDIRAMQAAMAQGGRSKLVNPKNISDLERMRQVMKNMRLRAFASDMQSIGLKLKKLGKDAQFVGRSLMINLTAPLTLFARFGLQALRDYDREAVRLTKVLENVAMTTRQAMAKTGISDESNEKVQELVKNFQFLDRSMSAMSQKFGIAKSLATGLAADFAELGIGTKENIVAITRLTAATEKLGGMDISQSQELIQAMYFQSVRAFESSGRAFVNAAAREEAAIKSATANLVMFNAIENVTALTLRDIGAAFPEVASMATTFGLSMIEAAAMLAPMKAAGLNVGASANAIKVSLQRLVAPTKQNEELMKRLSKTYANTAQGSQAFENATRSGLTGLKGIVEAFQAVRTETGGLEGPMQLMSKIFGVRQGPRMTIAIQQLAEFDEKLRGVNTNGKNTEKVLADIASTAANNIKLSVTDFTKIGTIARVATAQINQEVEGFGRVTAKDISDARRARQAVGEEILKAQREGRDLMTEISSEAGRAMMVQLAGASSASEIANRELDQALGSLDVTLAVLRNNFKLFAADIITNLRPTIENITKLTSRLLEKWNNLSSETRERIGKLILAIGGALAAIGPLILAMGTLASVTGILTKGVFKFFPSLKNVEGGFIGVTAAAKKAGTAFRNTGQQFDTTYKKFARDKGLIPAPAIATGRSATATPAVASALAGSRAASAAAASSVIPPRLMRRGANIVNQATGQVIPTRGRGPFRGSAALARSFRQEETFLTRRAGINVTPASGYRAPGIPSAGTRVRGALSRVIPGVSRPGGLGVRTVPSQLVADAISARQAGFQRTGVSRTGAGNLMFRGRQVSESRGLAIARGGARGRLATAASIGPRGVASAAGQAVAGRAQAVGSGAARIFNNLGPVNAYKSAIERVAVAQKQLMVNSLAFGNGAPGMFKKATTAVAAFTKAQTLATVAAKLLKFAVISSGIGVIFLAIGVAVFAVVKNFDRFKEVASAGIDKVKNAWNVFKGAIMEIIRPFVDLFSMFGKGSAGGVGAAEALGKAFNKVGEAVNFVAGLFASLVRNVIQPWLYYIINIVMAVVSVFKGNWSEALGFLQSAFAHGMTSLVSIVSTVIKVIIRIFFGIPAVMAKVAGMAVKFFIEAFTILPRFVYGLLSKLPFADKIFGPIKTAADAAVNFAKAAVDTGVNAVSSALGAASNASVAFIDGLANGIKNGLKGMKGKGITASVGKVFKDSTGTVTKAGKELGEDAAEAITNATGEELDDKLADKVAKAFKDSVKGLAQKLQDYVMNEMANALNDFANSAEKALQKQRDAAVAVYEQQLTTLMKLEKAEESLTKTKEYEANRRRMIDERALQSLNYQRNRALAIYEGRIDDARMLDLEDIKNSRESQRNISDLDSERRKDLAKENLDALREAIKEAQTAADKFYDEAIEKFKDAVSEITKFPPVTIEDYKKQLEQLTALATKTATDTGVEFGKMFDEFTASVNSKMPNEGIPAFTENLDTLVKVAVEKYGLGKSTGDSSTIIGSTIGMLVGMGGVMGDNKDFVVSSFGQITQGMEFATKETTKIIVDEIMAKFFEDYKTAVEESDADKVLAKALADGNRAIIDDFRKTVGGVGSAVDDMMGKLDPLILKWAALEAAAKAAGEAQANAGSGGSSGGAPGVSPGGRGTVPELRRLRPDLFNPRPSTFGNGSAPHYFGNLLRSNGGRIRKMAVGGYLNAAASQSIPALLHGGEYIMSAQSVRNIGLGVLDKMNNTRFSAPRVNTPSDVRNISMSTQNTNIYVENFIGEEEWFKSMMEEYGINTAQRKIKSGGKQKRIFNTYKDVDKAW